MADSESAALTGLGDTPVPGAVGETRTLMPLGTATSRLRVYQFRHDRIRLIQIVFTAEVLSSTAKLSILARNLIRLQVLSGIFCRSRLFRGRHRPQNTALVGTGLLLIGAGTECHSNGGAEKDRGGNSGGTRQEVRGPRRTEE